MRAFDNEVVTGLRRPGRQMPWTEAGLTPGTPIVEVRLVLRLTCGFLLLWIGEWNGKAGWLEGKTLRDAVVKFVNLLCRFSLPQAESLFPPVNFRAAEF
jgi:hypothetical protein